MSHCELAGKLWALANYITAFAIAQVLAVLLALANRQMPLLGAPRARTITLWVTPMFTILYVAAIACCGWVGAQLSQQHPKVWYVVMAGQIVAVLLFSGLLLLALMLKPKRSHRPRVNGTSTGAVT
jgi:hypothetical protein